MPVTTEKKKEALTANDEELIEMAFSSTYPSEIRKYIKQADTEKARNIMRGLLSDGDVQWKN